MSLLPGVVKYNKRENKKGYYGINGEGKGLKSIFVFFFCGWFPASGGKGDGG